MNEPLLEALHDEDLPLPARLDAAREILRELETAKARVRELAHDLVRTVALDDDLTATLYWDYEDIVPSALLGRFHELRGIVEPRCPWTYPCPTCGVDLPVTSRSKLKELRKLEDAGNRDWRRSGHLCPSCLAVRDAGREESYRAQQAAHRARVRELRTMPYRQYLQSPEWQERRKARLKAARYACQVCNARNKVLNVHHRTYERRGDELPRDLIVLCEDCHHLFHRNGSLAPHGEGDR